jgi:hypothetical protein
VEFNKPAYSSGIYKKVELAGKNRAVVGFFL